jgi:hypothetical protein
MFEKLKSKLTPSQSRSKSQTAVESPSQSPPSYVEDNPMFPATPSVNQNNESMGFILGTAFPKAVKAKGKRKEKSILRPVEDGDEGNEGRFGVGNSGVGSDKWSHGFPG